MNLREKFQWNERTIQQLVAYEALFKLLDDIQPLEDIGKISKAVAKQWKYFANVSCWRLVIPKNEEFLVIDGFRGEGHVSEVRFPSPWDAYHLASRVPRLVRMADSFTGPQPPEHLTGKALVEIQILPFLRMDRCIGLLSAGARHQPFNELDNKFIRIFGSHFTDRISDILLRRQIMETLIDKATRDMLTGLLNRGAITECLENLLTTSRHEHRPLSVIIADLDYFKNINDNFGHPVGDAVLREISHRLHAHILSGDNLGRYGGEEFLFVLYPCSSEEVMKAAERFRRVIAETPVVAESGAHHDIKVTISLGTSSTDGQENVGLETLLKQADEALYRSKTSGRNRVTAWTGDSGST